MSDHSLKHHTISGFFWNALQRYGCLMTMFIGNLILARLLSIEDFGCIGMLAIFIAISNTFIDGGFGAALIQKKTPTAQDYSTIFYWNIIVSVLLYVVLFFCAPAIARFYEIPLLSDVLRVQGLVLFSNALSIIQTNQLMKRFQFKKIAAISLSAYIIGVGMGIFLAYRGFGVWSLVIQMLAISVMQAILSWILNSWRPLWVFSGESFRNLFGFGGMMLLSSINETIYTNIQSLIIGRTFSVKALGLYSQAKKLEEVPSSTLALVVNQVTFPVFSQLQDDLVRMKSGLRKNMQVVAFASFAIMALLVVVAEPLFTILYTHKWGESVPYFQVLCLVGMIYSLNSLSMNMFKALGKSRMYFYIQLLKQILGLTIIFIGMQFGLMGMMWSLVLNVYLFFIINSYFVKKIINYGLLEQIRDVGPNYIVALASGAGTYLLTCNMVLLDYPELFVTLAIFFAIYWSLSHAFKLGGYVIVYNIVMEKLRLPYRLR